MRIIIEKQGKMSGRWNRTTKVFGSLRREEKSIALATLGYKKVRITGTDHSDGLHVPADEGEETLSAEGHLLLLLLLAHLCFLQILSASRLEL
jgi:hypothetical protein